MNECQIDNGNCEHMCTNSDGSFQCLCSRGYSLAPDNLKCDGKNNLCIKIFFQVLFIDINECQNNNGGCMQFCNNSNGSFECFCDRGYTLAVDGLSCEGKSISTCTDGT